MDIGTSIGEPAITASRRIGPAGQVAAIDQSPQMLAHGGKIAAAVWDIAPKVPTFSLAYILAQKMFQSPLPPEGTLSPFGLTNGIAEKTFAQAGFVDVSSEALKSVLELSSVEALRQFLRNVNVPLISMLAHQSAERRIEYWQEHALAVTP